MFRIPFVTATDLVIAEKAIASDIFILLPIRHCRNVSKFILILFSCYRVYLVSSDFSLTQAQFSFYIPALHGCGISSYSHPAQDRFDPGKKPTSLSNGHVGIFLHIRQTKTYRHSALKALLDLH